MAKGDSNEVRLRIHKRIRKALSGTEGRPRLCVFRSNSHIYAQIVDDSKGTTVAAASTVDAETKDGVKNGGNIAAAKAVGTMVAKRALDKGVRIGKRRDGEFAVGLFRKDTHGVNTDFTGRIHHGLLKHFVFDGVETEESPKDVGFFGALGLLQRALERIDG